MTPRTAAFNARNSPRQAGSASDEIARLEEVRRYRILDTPPDGAFDRVTALAARLFQVPIAIVSIVDSDRIWFKSHHGLDVGEIARDPGLCASAILQYEPWIVTDAKVDPRALANPLVAEDFGLRFYAGMPLTTPDGHNLGTICVIDKEPREVTPAEHEILRDLASIVMDQLGLRLSSLEALEIQTRLRREAEAERERVGHLAQTLQRSLLPPHLPEIPGLDLASVFVPAEGEVGGDFYDVFPVSSRSWGIVMGDVCGKGPEAAAMTALVRYTLRAAASDTVSPADVLSKVNEILTLRESSADGRFCTLAFARFKPTKVGAKIRVASGGHPLPLLLRASGRVEPVGGTGYLVGSFPDAEFSVHGRTMLPGDAMLFYTDGVTEARSLDEVFGDQRLSQALSGCAGLTAREIVLTISRQVVDFGGGGRDDIALLALKVSEPALL